MVIHESVDLDLNLTPRPDLESNVLKTGTSADHPRVPEDDQLVNSRTSKWFDSFYPQDLFHCWLINEIVTLSTRIDHNGRIERRLRDRGALVARLFWDDHRKLEAIRLGEKLATEPSTTCQLLRQTPQGCDWLMARWAVLARMANLEGGWTPDQKAMAFNLLGVRLDERSDVPGEAIDLDGKLVNTPIGQAELARQQVAELVGRKQKVAELDALDKSMAMADYVFEPTPDFRRVRRHDAALHRRMRWSIDQINFKSPYNRTKPQVYDHLKDLPYVRTAEPLEIVGAPSQPDDQPQPASETAISEPEAKKPLPKPKPKPAIDPEREPWLALFSKRQIAREAKEARKKKAEARRRERLRA